MGIFGAIGNAMKGMVGVGAAAGKAVTPMTGQPPTGIAGPTPAAQPAGAGRSLKGKLPGLMNKRSVQGRR